MNDPRLGRPWADRCLNVHGPTIRLSRGLKARADSPIDQQATRTDRQQKKVIRGRAAPSQLVSLQPVCPKRRRYLNDRTMLV